MSNQVQFSGQSDSSAGIPALNLCVPADVGPARLMHDATLARPLRIRDSQGVKLPPELHQAIARPLGTLDGLLHPLSLHYLRADLDPRADAAAALDGRRIGCLPRLLYAHAAAAARLQGVELSLRLSVISVPADAAPRSLDTRSDIQADETALADPAVAEAVGVYADWVARTWARCVATTLGPWVLASGIRELRLTGAFRPDHRQQLAVLAGADIGPAARP